MSDDTAALRAALLRGEVALIPTDTVYGLAAALDVPAGVDALYRLKGRPRSQPCQVVLFDGEVLAAAIAALEAGVRAAAEVLLPGPVTCIVPDPDGRYAAAAGDAPGSVGLRAPAMVPPIGVDLPLIATSANHPGGADPASLADVPVELRAAARALDLGPLPGTASAVVDLRPLAGREPAALLRPGPDPDGLRSHLAAAGVVLVAVYPRDHQHEPGGRAA